MNRNELEILLIEDNPDDAALAIRALKKQGMANKLIHLKNGVEALDFIFGSGDKPKLTRDNHPRVILLDLKMPMVDGMEVLEKVKSDPETKSIPVVILTSSAEDPDIRKCYELGANSYIVKPVEFDNFSKTVIDLGFYWMLMNKVNK
ncbi:MAG TPA: response regulator [Bacteroidia bacterium]|jgi:two-component system response regulator|nr:response regulator [Bacteroidia bacterium]